jgi:hypothetical protein
VVTVHAERTTRRVTFNVDTALLEAAGELLGTTTTTETLNGALADVVRQARLRSLAQREFPDLTPEALETMRRAWRPR